MNVFTLKADKPRIVVPASFRARSDFFAARFSKGRVTLEPVEGPRGRRIARNLWEWGDLVHLQAR